MKVSFYSMFRFADKIDCLFMAIGSIGALGVGASLPILTLVISSTIDELFD